MCSSDLWITPPSSGSGRRFSATSHSQPNARADKRQRFRYHSRIVMRGDEMYEADVNYAPGTVVKIGGEKEITQTTDADDTDVFGVISDNPAYLLNAGLARTKLALPVALEGRVPVKVIGPVKKGDRLVSSSTPGTAKASSKPNTLAIIGRALQSSDEEGIRTIEVVVGVR